MIKLVAFDVGGVLMEADYFARLSEAFGLFFDDTLKLEKLLRERWNEWKLGKTTEKKVFESISAQLKLDSKKLEKASKVFYKEFVPDKKVIDLIKLIHKNYKTAILSNTVREPFELQKKLFNLNSLFDLIVTSFETGYAKPDKRIYKILIEKSGFNLQEIVFIDDKQRNLESAKQLGVKTILFKDAIQLEKELKELGMKLGNK